MAEAYATVTTEANSLDVKAPATPEEKEFSRRQAILSEGRARFKMSADTETPLRARMLDDKLFRAGEHWPAHVKAQRQGDKRTILTIDRVGHPIRLVTNQQRESGPAIQIKPVDDQADPKTAEILQGQVRAIEHDSHADVAYDTAFEDAVVMGRGYFRVLTEYERGSFNQVIKIKRIRNPFTVYMDPSAQEVDYSDAKYGFIVEDLTAEEFRRQYPKAELVSLEDFKSIGDQTQYWVSGQKIRVAEYFYVDYRERRLWLMSDESVLFDDDPLDQPKMAALAAKGIVPAVDPGTNLPVSRTEKVPFVRWVKMSGAEILKETIWLGEWIPIVPVLGDEIDLGTGEVDLRGIVRDAKDPNRMFDYWVSAVTEEVALANKVPIVGAVGQFKTHRAKWAEANNKHFAYLEYDPVEVGGKMAPPPSRMASVDGTTVAAMVQLIAQADNAIKATTKFYDASLAQKGPQESGRAIAQRQQQDLIGNAHYIDNLSRALWHLGRILLDLMPKIYNRARVIRITGTDDKSKTVKINQKYQNEAGEEVYYDYSKGKYDVVVAMGKSYLARRQEAAEAMAELVKAFPNLMAIAGDLFVSMLDFPDAVKIAERLKKALPPQLQEQDDKEPVPAHAQAKIAALSEQHEILTKLVNDFEERERTKKLELASKEMIAGLQESTKAAIALTKLEAESATTLLKAELQKIESMMQLSQERLLMQADVNGDGNLGPAAPTAAPPPQMSAAMPPPETGAPPQTAPTA